jgi:ankyrin repeat protein
MLRILFFTVGFFWLFNASAQTNSTQKVATLDEINSDLKARKAKMEPFKSSDLKAIDVESLGLDDVDTKSAAKKTQKPITQETNKPQEETKETLTPQPESKNADKDNSVVPNFVEKIQNFLDKDKAQKTLDDAANLPKKSDEESINPVKKKNIKKRLELEKRRKKNDKIRQTKLEKLKELRQKYLIKIDENSGDELIDDEEKIVPKPKELNPFIVEELPAPPILERYRSPDNLHIPLIPTIAQRVEVLFDSISSGNVALFNNAYKNVENPNAYNKFGDSILSYAVILQKYSIIAAALAKGANPNLPNSLGYRPIDIAIELLDFRSLELLVENNADIKHIDNFNRTYLMQAARAGFLSAAELLVSRGVDINAMDIDGFTALSIAHRNQKEVIVKFLLKKGAKPWIEKRYEPEKKSLIKELENRWR